MMRMTAVMYAVVIAALLSGCEEQPEKPPAKQTTPEVTSEQPAVRARGLEITLGDHATSALEALVAECHVPSPEELAIISVLSREGAPVEDTAPALGVALPEDDFARGKAKKELEEKLAAHKKELGAKVLCLRLEVGVERYDFDRERFALKEDNAFAVVTDLTENATTQRERLSLERGVELGDSPWPAMLVAVLPGKHISASKKDAERVNDALHPATVNEEEDTSEPVEETSQKERRNDPFTALTRLATKGEKEALLASADVFCLPSTYDSFGMGFVEAMMQGTPVVAADWRAISDVVAPPPLSALVPAPPQPAALAEAIRAVLEAKPPREAVREHALNHFAAERVIDRALNDVELAFFR